MKATTILAILSLMTVHALGQGSIDEALKTIESNNNDIKAAKALYEARSMEARAANTLGDTSVEYEKMFGVKGADGETGKVTVTQELEFPTIYATRGKVTKQRANSYMLQYEETRRDILLTAKELCIDLVTLRRQNALIKEKLANIARLREAGERRLAAGEITAIDYNKVKMQEMEENAALTLNVNEIDKTMRMLAAINGGREIDVADCDLGKCNPLPEFEALSDEVMASDASLMRSISEHKAADAELRLQRNKWLPSLSLSYIREIHPTDADNGIEIGVSLPLWNNARTVRQARANKAYAMYVSQSVHDNVSEDMRRSYDEADNLRQSLQAYDTALVHDNIDMLKRALDSGQISTIDYFTEVNSLYGMLQTYHTLRGNYEKALARLYKHRL